MVTCDTAYVGDKWVPASALEAWDPAKAKEGLLRPGAQVYSENGHEVEALSVLDPISIDSEEPDDRYRIGAAGGYVGFIDRADFLPGPFLKIIDQSGDAGDNVDLLD